MNPKRVAAVVAPSSTFARDALQAGVRRLGEHFDVRCDPRVYDRAGFLAGDDSMRAEILVAALRDPDVRVVFVARGGYGCTRVLEIAGEALRDALVRDPKPIVGFSDVTALHALWYAAGVVSVHGPMVAAIGRGTVREEDVRALIASLDGGPAGDWNDLDVVVAGAAEGKSFGGNLAVLTSLCGTRHFPDLNGTVLFLEDVTEKPYRIDRMLTTLRMAGAFTGVRAFVLGDFVDCEPGPDGVGADDVLAERLCDLGVPIVRGAPFGHGTRNAPIAFGSGVLVADGSVRWPAPARSGSTPP